MFELERLVKSANIENRLRHIEPISELQEYLDVHLFFLLYDKALNELKKITKDLVAVAKQPTN